MPPGIADIEAIRIYDLSSRGMTQKQIAKELGVSHVTLAKRMGSLQASQGLLLKYRSTQTLQLTELQARVLEAATPEKIKSASLRELINAYKILKTSELGISGKPSKITWLMSYLIELEKNEVGA